MGLPIEFLEESFCLEVQVLQIIQRLSHLLKLLQRSVFFHLNLLNIDLGFLQVPNLFQPCLSLLFHKAVLDFFPHHDEVFETFILVYTIDVVDDDFPAVVIATLLGREAIESEVGPD